jgi:hypothetical protein
LKKTQKKKSSPKKKPSKNALSITCKCGDALRLTPREQRAMLKTLTADAVLEVVHAHFHHGGVFFSDSDTGIGIDVFWPRKKLRRTKKVIEAENSLRATWPWAIGAILNEKPMRVVPTTDDRTFEQRNTPMTADCLVDLLDAALPGISDDVKLAAAHLLIERAERATAAGAQ